jgi:hypothetical protein
MRVTLVLTESRIAIGKWPFAAAAFVLLKPQSAILQHFNA